MKILSFQNLLEYIKQKGGNVNISLLRKMYGISSSYTEDYRDLTLVFNLSRLLIDFGFDGDIIIASLGIASSCNSDSFFRIVEEQISEYISDLIKGFFKIHDLGERLSDLQNENFEGLKKILVSSSFNIYALVLYISERLLFVSFPELFIQDGNEIVYANDNLGIYSSIAEYLGMNALKSSIDDASFKILEKEKYNAIENFVFSKNGSFSEYLHNVEKSLKQMLKGAKIKGQVFGRKKSTYSIYKKMLKRKGFFDVSYIKNFSDIYAFTILVESVEQCYKVLGVCNSNFISIKEKFDDYIANPKPNGFKALQTSLHILGDVVEIQIKTEEMHNFNEYGDASHIGYKGTKNNSWALMLSKLVNKDGVLDIKEVLSDKIFVFTPGNLVKELDVGATPVDFAYSVHTKIGNLCVGAKVNGKLVSLDSKLKTGDIVEILTDKNRKIPNEEWLNFVVMSSTKKNIKKFVKEASVTTTPGGNIKKDIKVENIDISNIEKKVSKGIGYKVMVKGVVGLKTKLAHCCNPVFGDNIVGRATIEGLIKIHKSSCKSISESTLGVFDAYWYREDSQGSGTLVIHGKDRVGILKEVTSVLSENNINILYLNTNTYDDKFDIEVGFNLLSKIDLSDIIKKILSIKSVKSVNIV